MKIQRSQVDYYIAFVVLIQSFLIVLQHVLISVFKIPAEDTTIYRVLLTAVPLSVAIAITFYRKWPSFLLVYGVTVIILLANINMFPQNQLYLHSLSIRYLLPIVIPSALCLMYVSNIEIVEKALYNISWLTTLLTVFYVIHFFIGTFEIRNYNMSFSYGLLLPLMSLYSKKNIYSLSAAAFLFITILAIGSRGAAIVFISFMMFDIFESSLKKRISLLFLLGLIILLLPLLVQWFENLGINSRTLNLWNTGNINQATGRDLIYSEMIDVFWNNPIKGIGLFGDRIYLNGSYTHNLILELYLNWGLIGATIIITYFIVKVITTYSRSDKNTKNILIKYSLAGVMPLMVSGSYLIDYDLGIFLGILFLISKNIKKRRRDLLIKSHPIKNIISSA